MDERTVTILLTCLDRAVERGFPLDPVKIEYAITAHAEGRPVLDGVNRDLMTFLEEVHLNPEDFFTDEESFRADIFLRNLETGGLQSSRSSFALAIPPGVNPDVDILVYEPHKAMEALYVKGLKENIGTPAERKAIEKLLWLRPLEENDYRLANAFMEKLFAKGIRGEGAQFEQAKFLIDLLSPSTDAHALVERLASSGLARQIRTTPTRGTPVPHLRNGAALAPLDDLLINLSHQIRQAAEDGDTTRVEQLLKAAQNVAKAVKAMARTPSPKVTAPAVFGALKGTAALPENEWAQFDKLAANPLMNIALMPLGVMEHILASIVMRELSWEESIDEAIDVLGGSALVGGTIWGSISAVNGIFKLAGDERVGKLMQRVNKIAPEKARAYLIPAIFLAAFTFVALRQTQNLPLGEANEYRWRFLEEMAEAFGIQLAVTGGAFIGIRAWLGRIGKIPKGRIGGAGVLAIATGAGMLAQEVFSSWRRGKMREDLKTKTYADLIRMLEALPKYPEHLKPKLQTKIDRKLAILIALNTLELPSIKEAVALAERREKELARLTSHGVSEERAIQWLSTNGNNQPLTDIQQKMAVRWIEKRKGKEATVVLPVTMLPAQKKRVVALWEKDLSDVVQFMVAPIPIGYKKESDGSIDPDQFEDWTFAHTLSLMNTYLRNRQEWN